MKSLFLTLLLAALPGLVAAQSPTPAAGTNPLSALAGMLQAFQGTNDPKTGAPPAEGDAMAAVAQFMQAFQGGTNHPLAALGGQPAVDFRELRALLPAELAGLRRTNTRGQKTGAFGAHLSEATGEYGESGGPRLEVKITDLGAMGPFGAMAGFGWMAAEIDREGDDGYERTTQFQGRKGLEKYHTAAKSGSVNLMAGSRFRIEIEGSNIEPAQLKATAEGLDLDALDRLAKRPQVE